MKRNLFSTILILCGIGLMVAAIYITGRNLWAENRAGERSEEVLHQLLQKMPSERQYAENERIDIDSPIEEANKPEVDNDWDFPLTMPEMEIDGVSYIGYLEVPALGLTLPVISQSTEDNLEIAPCRFYGTAYQKNFVIGGHRYGRHFRNIHTLSAGDEIRFTDVTGRIFVYEVLDFETLRANQAEYLCSGDWYLTLYTCTVGGYSRVAVRCVLK